MPIILSPLPVLGAKSYALIDVTGVEHTLDSSVMVRADGVDGWWMPKGTVTRDQYPFQPGSRIRRARHEEREFDLPLYLEAATMAGLHALKRAVLTWFVATEGDVILKATAPDGSVRQLTARYLQGLESLDKWGRTGGETWQYADATLLAPSPYWEDLTDQTATYVAADSLTTWFTGQLFSLTVANQFSSAFVNNQGDIDAWPIWTLHGPATLPSLRNVTSGGVLSLGLALVAGDSVTIDTRPGVRTITDQSGNSLFSSRAAGSTFWPLTRGINEIRVEMAATSVATSVSLAYRQQFLSP